MSEVLDLHVSTTASGDQLRARLEQLYLRLAEVSDAVDTALTGYEQATDPVAKDARWDRYQAVLRDYRVLGAWAGIFYSAYIFSTDGADCAALDSLT